jgi:hypothetical protein
MASIVQANNLLDLMFGEHYLSMLSPSRRSILSLAVLAVVSLRASK